MHSHVSPCHGGLEDIPQLSLVSIVSLRSPLSSLRVGDGVQGHRADLEVLLSLSANPALLEGGTWEVAGQGWGDTPGLWGGQVAD